MSNTVDYYLDEQVGFLLRRVHQAASAVFQSQLGSVYALTPPQFACLVRLYAHGEVTQNQLGRMVDMNSATVQGVVSRLMERDLIDREQDQQHRRRLILRLSTSGRRLVEAAIPAAIEVSKETLSPLSDEERGQFIYLLKKLVQDRECE